MRNQQQREQQRGGERADIVEGQHLGDQVAELQPVLEDAHEQRDLQPHQRADHQHQAIERQAEVLHAIEQQEQQRGRAAADCCDQHLDADEHRRLVRADIARAPRAHAHREQIGADDCGELRDAVAQQIGGERAGEQLVDQATGRDDEGRREQRPAGA